MIDGARGDLFSLRAGGQQMALILSLCGFGILLGGVGVGVEGIDLLLALGENVLDGLEEQLLEQDDLKQQVTDLRDGRPRCKLYKGLKIHATVLLPMGKIVSDHSRPVNIPGATKIRSRPMTKP